MANLGLLVTAVFADTVKNMLTVWPVPKSKTRCQFVKLVGFTQASKVKLVNPFVIFGRVT